jgi:putative PEP-CTERM system histidine kinase
MPGVETSFAAISYAVGAAAFLILLVPLAAGRRRRLPGALLAAACAATLAWTAAAAVHYGFGGGYARLVAVLEVVRSIAWLAVLVGLFRQADAAIGRAPYLAPALVVVGVAVAAAGALGPDPAYPPPFSTNPWSIVGLCFAVAGLFLTEASFRGAPAEQRWHIKFLSLSTGTIFAYDLYLYADATLFGIVDPALQEARGAVQALAVPMLAVTAARIGKEPLKLSISRQLILRSTTFIAGGTYLLLMALAGYYLREVDDVRGPAFQVVFLVGAVAVLLVVLLSGTSLAYLKILVNKHLFPSTYDWREEWLRFVRTLEVDQPPTPLEARCIKSVADIVESPGGALWLREADRFESAFSWNLDIPGFAPESDDSLSQFLERTGWIVDLVEAAAQAKAYDGLTVPKALLADRRAWLVIPLWHRSLIGFMVLAKPRAPRTLGWEDFDLLKTVGRQVASYLAEQRAALALDEAREFEIFNRSFAFVVHDLKNLVSQLSLLAPNIEKYGNRKAFRDDLVITIRETGDKMKRLVDRIHVADRAPAATEVAELSPLIRDLIEAKKDGLAALSFDCQAPSLAVAGDAERLQTVIGLLVQNAIEAVGEDGRVDIVLAQRGRSAIIEVTDNGPGMETEFIRTELFKPFRSTKESGMGLGAYQCRVYARELGGNLEAVSNPGEGTKMRITLPLARAGHGLRARPASMGRR